MIKKSKLNKKNKNRNMIKNISLIFLSLMIFSSILLGNFDISNNADDENMQISIENDFENQKVLSSSSQIIWTQTWDGPSYERAYSIWGDGTYLYTTGHTTSFGANNGDLFLIKWDTNGDLIWNKTWGNSESDKGLSIWGDGTYLYTTGQSYHDFLLIKWDTDGNEIWNKTWGNPESYNGVSIWGDGTYLYITGYISYSGYDYDLLITKWDTNGNQIWFKYWDNLEIDIGLSIFGDGTYLYVTGYSGNSFENTNLILIKWDTNGNQIWNKNSGNSDVIEWGKSIWADGNYIYTTGFTPGYGTNHHVLLLIKWDTDGNQIWNKTWGNSESNGFSVWGDGTYIYTAGNTNIEINCEILLIKWDTDGNVVWFQTMGGPYLDEANSIWGDGTYLYMTGVYQFVVNNYGLIIIKMHPEVIQTPNMQSISPNPNLDGNITLNWNDIAEATSYDLYRETYNFTTVSDLVPISTSTFTSYTDINLTNGGYFYAVVAKDGERESNVSICESVSVEIPDPPKNKISGYPFEFITSIGVISIVLLTLKKRK
jgi:hypothetical protein